MEARRKNLKRALGAGCALAVLAMATGAAAQQRTFNIASSKATDAIPEFARQAGIQIVAPADRLRGVSTPAITGQYDTRQALAMLIEGTGLRIVSDDGRTIMLAAADPQGAGAAGAGAEVEALIVTAQKREEDIQDVPIAISAFTQEDLTRSQIAGGPDLITQVPNMTFTKTNFSSYSIQIRGIGTQAISATTDPAVSVAFNNTPFIRNHFFEQEFYDLQRVEVLRGPQGTLYGRNATAGVVNVISAKPKFNFEAKASGDVSNYNSSRIEGMVNIPLVEDMVALRLAGAWTKRDGYAVNELSADPIDGRDLWSTRVSLRAQPSSRLDVNLIWEHFEENDDRLRSGKQLCKKDVVTDVGGVPIENYLDTSIAGGQGLKFAGVQGALSQGCKRNSLYAMDSFQRPTGLMLPYYAPLGAVGLVTALNDPYVSPVLTDPTFVDTHLVDITNDQPEDLRVIQSVIDPTYRAKSDLGELQISFDLTDTLTLTSETAYSTDTIYSLQDFNRFNTAPGAWGGGSSNIPRLISNNVLRTDLGPNLTFCDPQLGCSDRLVAVDIATADSSAFSQELRLASNFDGAFNFSLGANFLRYDTEDKYYVFINSLTLVALTNGIEAGTSGTSTPYIPGRSDNASCMENGYQPGDPSDVYPVTGCSYVDPNPIGEVNDQGHNYFLSRNPYKLLSYAVFGEAYWNITDDLKLTAGLRYTLDQKEAPRIPTWILASNSVGYPVAEVIEQEWREPTGRLALDWKPDLAFTDATLLYGSYAHGYKAGGANPPGFVRIFYSNQAVAQGQSDASATRPTTFDPEFVDAFELGAKNTLADGRVTLNLAAFYYDYKDYQISEIVDRSAFNRNFDATVWGVEIEADWRPLENFRLGFKGGYEKTRIADGEQAIDLMDRTAGDPDWLVVRPFPTYASSCILPTFVFVNPDGTLGRVGGVGGGSASGCELAYQLGLDPVTANPYIDLTSNPPPLGDGIGAPNNIASHPGYPGWDPLTAPNGGEGIMKPLGGNQLPNAPNWTGTITADYTIPLPNEWLATLHTDLHWQSESWWRVFNDHEYGKLDEYFTMNLAAIFTNEERGWSIMAYIKNVTDETAITGAFLNSDDTGLTTNIFLTEPRLYGLRVTKAWTGGPLLGGFGARGEGPHPFTVEILGHVQREEAPNTPLKTPYSDEFTGPVGIFDHAQNGDFDWGDGRGVRLTYQPEGGRWKASAAVRYGRNKGEPHLSAANPSDPVCLFGGPFQGYCTTKYDDPILGPYTRFSKDNNAEAVVNDKEEHQFVEFAVGREVNIGGVGSTLSVGIRHATFDSETEAMLRGVPDWVIPEYAMEGLFEGPRVTHTLYKGSTSAHRSFDGLGPFVSWEAAAPLWDVGDAGRIDMDWSLEGGVLFGNQTTTITGEGESFYTSASGAQVILPGQVIPPGSVQSDLPPIRISRDDEAIVPTLAFSLGLSYALDRMTVGAGYRWERYFDAIDGGFAEEETYDRTIDGPYFKVSVGFGG